MGTLRYRYESPRNLDGVLARMDASPQFMRTRTMATVEAYTDASVFTVKQRILGLPVRAPQDRGLRRSVSKGVGRRRTKHGYRVTTSAPPGYQWWPRYVMKQWSHPVFGRQDEVLQSEQWDWFLGPISNFHAPMENQMRQNVESLVQFIGK